MTDATAYLTFEGWFRQELDERAEWITVARRTEERPDETRLATDTTWCAMVPPGAIPQLLANTTWDIETGFSTPSFYEDGGTVRYLGGPTRTGDGITFEALVHYRSFNEVRPTHFAIADDFVNYAALYPDAEHWVEPITGDTVVKRVQPEWLQVRRSYLVDYLAARKLVLMRFHDHFRHACVDEVTEVTEDVQPIENSHFDIYVRKFPTGAIACTKHPALGGLRGKDVVLAAAEPSHPDYKMWKKHATPPAFPEYLVRTRKGVERLRPDHELIENRQLHLSVSYFHPDVLLRYTSKPNRYGLSRGSIEDRRDRWQMPFARTTSGAVHVWFRDLERFLPPEEHVFWQPFSIEPSGDLQKGFLSAAIDGKFAEPDDQASRFRLARERLDKAATKGVGRNLFRPLSSDDHAVLESIHQPVTNEREELATQVTGMQKMCIEMLDADAMRSLLPDPARGKNAKGERLLSIGLLEVFLQDVVGASPESVGRIAGTLRDLQTLRSKLAAHATSSAQIAAALAAFGVTAGTEFSESFKVVAGAVADQLNEAATLFAKT